MANLTDGGEIDSFFGGISIELILLFLVIFLFLGDGGLGGLLGTE
ncbi:MAG: hypothetical protein ACQEQI_01480 [Bacillota bacterium]